MQSWLTGEPLTIIIDVVNHGPDCGEATLRIEIAPEFEALSPLVRKISPLKSFGRTSFALQLVPRVDGKFPMIINALVSLEDGTACTINTSQLDLEVMPALSSFQRSSVPQDNEILLRLREVLQDANMGSVTQNLNQFVG